MPKTKEQKVEIIQGLKQGLEKQKSVVLVDFQGLDAKALFSLRDELKKEDCQLQVVKKTLFIKVLENLKQEKIIEKIEQIKGQIALVFGFSDEVAPAKICYEFGKKNETLKILGGFLTDEFIEQAKMIELAQLPSREELLARLVGSLNAPVSNFVYTLKANIKGLVVALNAIKETK